jgi:signal transduction histidine kinase
MLEKEVETRTAELSETNMNLELEIMERKKIEKELKKTNIELNALLENLKKTQAQLVDAEKMASLGQLTAGIAHEINNPINFVSGNINPLLRDIDDMIQILNRYDKVVEDKNLEEQFKEIKRLKEEVDYRFLISEIKSLIEGIREGAVRTTEIVKGLRNFSRLDETEFKLSDIHEGLDSTLLILTNKLKKNIEVIKDYGNIPRIYCYPGQLNQVFMNILNNAIQAIHLEGKIWIKTSMDENYVFISIRDSGVGMSPEMQKRVFEPFFTTKEVGKGTGLGLSITYGIIEKHNGKISVISKVGKGSEFIISLPIRQPNK